MANNTEILLHRTAENASSVKEATDKLGNSPLNFGEPVFIDNNSVPHDETGKCSAYLALGSNVENNKNIRNAVFFKGFWDLHTADKLVFYNDTNTGIVKEDGTPVYADRLTTSEVALSEDSTKYHILCQANVTQGNTDVNNIHGKVQKFNMGDNGIYVTSNGVMHGAAWNDYAEKRKVSEELTPGTIVCENGDGTLSSSTYRLQPCAYVVSDTYGFVIGEEKDTPVAVSGRALVSTNEPALQVGDCVCAGPNGKAAKMTRQEIINYPDRIVGIVTEIPSYDKWNGIAVNDRIWVKIK